VTGGIGTGTLLDWIVKNAPIYAYVDVDERTFLRYGDDSTVLTNLRHLQLN
jgi:hypothetical protein